MIDLDDDDAEEMDIEEIAEMFETDSDVEDAESNAIMHALLTPNDDRYNEQWSYFGNRGGIRADLAWDKATGDGVVVAVIDTGRTPHSELDSNTLPVMILFPVPQELMMVMVVTISQMMKVTGLRVNVVALAIAPGTVLMLLARLRPLLTTIQVLQELHLMPS